MAATGTGAWIKFFKDAGLPSSAGATYALTFTENRIRMDMLLDLNKEMLKDMKITLIGDVIAILRHAKRVHEQTAREKVLAGSPATAGVINSPLPAAAGRSSPNNSSDSGNSSPRISIGDTTPKQRSSAALSRMVERYAKRTDSSERSAPKSVVPAVKMVTVVKRKVKAKESASTSTSTSAPPSKKVRRVLPEHEGGYKITMPSGSTPRSQQILAKQRLVPAKKTVFERLGEGSVTSTTGGDGPLITITGLGTKIVKNNTDKISQSSVFSRLGDKQRVTSSTAPDLDDDDDLEEYNDDPSPYVGVLKLPATKTVVKKVPDSIKMEEATMRADAETSSVVKKKVLLHSRLGKTKTGMVVKRSGILSTIVKPGTVKTMKLVKKSKNKTAGILANPTNATKISVKSRLGSSLEGSIPIVSAATTTVLKKKPQPIVFSDPSSTMGKTVTFGPVTQKIFNPVHSNSHPRITMTSATKRPSVFGRLGT